MADTAQPQKTTAPKTAKQFPWYQSGLILVGFAAGVLVATSVDMVARIVRDEDVSTDTITAADKCREEGGMYNRGDDKCVYVTEDRGDTCQDNKECDGWCIVSDDAKVGDSGEGKCSEDFHPKGCVKFMDNGIVNAICLPE